MGKWFERDKASVDFAYALKKLDLFESGLLHKLWNYWRIESGEEE